MSLRDFIRQTKMLIEHGLYVTRGTANGGVYERPLEAARLEERILFSASAMAPVAAEIANAGEAVASALALMADDATARSEGGPLSDQQFLDLIAETILPQAISQSPSDSSANHEDTLSTEDPATHFEQATPGDASADNSGIELVFVDNGIADYEGIVEDIRASTRSTRAVQIVLLDSTQDGLKQINLYMSGMTQTVDTVHFITHGTDRALKLGSTWIDAGSVASHQSDFEQWRNVLSSDADLVFYGCDLAGGESGRSILESIALWTDADVAASDDSTGLQSLGGDWDLEYSIGDIESAIIVSGELQREWHGLLATFTVTNTNDSGAGSLRQAIIDANNLAGTDTIAFSIGSGVQTISLSTILPNITDTVIINGTTQSGYAGTPLIVITGNNSIQDGLRLYAGSDNSTIRGLVLQGFTQDAIDVTSSGNTIRGNYIGTNAAGTAAAANSNGINIWSGDNNIVGGTTAADRNVISGNTNVGMIISGGANNTEIYGNYIGLNAAGTGAIGNTYHGIVIDNSNGTILGGTTAGHRNVISGNGSLGITMLNADNSVIYGNYIGTNAAGTADVNGTAWNSSQSGILVGGGSSGNQIGSTIAGARNIISGNNHYGVEIMDSTSVNNTVSGNYIGTDVTGLSAVGNTGGGVSFWEAGTGNIASNNVISGNLYVGVLVGNASTGATIQGNSIGLGADGSTVVGNSYAGVYVYGGSIATLIGTNADGSGDAAEGNTISGNSHGIIVSGAGTTGTLIQGNRIGTNAAGTLDRGNANDGVLIENGASNTSIGGTATGAGNLISGNNEGIELTGSTTTLNTIQGNLIGLNVSGTGTIGNDFDGIHVSMGAHHNTIGGTTTGARNVIAGNGTAGIQVEGSGSDYNTIQGNFVGTDITGLIGLGNGSTGVKLGNSAANNLVGGTTAGAGNVIADNNQSGIEINSSSSNTVQGNLIGIGADGVTVLGNSLHGIDINSGGGSNLIGGVDPGAGNTIANSGFDGVSVDNSGGSNNTILGNSITLNGARGIDLFDDGVTLNDVGDADSGPNNLQNFPVLARAISSRGDTTISGTLNSTANTSFRIEFFSSPTADSTGYGEGKAYLGFVDVTTNSSGNASFNTILSGVTVTSGHKVSATATVDLGGGVYRSTSEFSESISATEGAGASQGLPASQSFNEGGTLTFSTANGNPIVVDDGTASTSALLQVSLSVPSGTLALSTTAGLSFPAGANGTGSMVIWGTEAAINTALDGLVFTPSSSDFNGTVNLSVTTALANALQGFYEFESSGTPGLDTSVGTLQNGSVQGNAAVVSDGTRGNVLTLDGTGDSLQINSMFGNPASITVGGWVNLSALSTGRAEFISLDNRVHIALDDAGGVKGSIQTGASTWADLNSNQFIAGTGWHHVMYVFDDVNNIHTLYIDGVAVASAVNTNSIYYTGSTTTYIGRHPVTTPGWDLEGQVDDVRIYSRALTAVEVAGLATDNHVASSSVLLTINAVNDAPLLDNTGTMSLNSLTEDQVYNAGQTVASIIASAGGDRITDVDSSPLEGIAITGLNSGNGKWQYSKNNGSSWSDIGTVSDSSALLLRSTDLVRFVTDGQNATSATIDFRAWDQTAGTFATKVDTTTNGGSTAFSTATETASITVTAVNDAPSLDFDANDSSGATLGGYRTLYRAGWAPVAVVDVDLTLTDPDDTVITQGEIVSFTGFVDAGDEHLTIGGAQFTIGTSQSTSIVAGGTTFGLVSDGTDLQVTVTAGAGSAADWKTLISSITYDHSGTPTVGERSFIFYVRDAQNARSNIVQSVITVTPNTSPTSSGTLGGTVSFTEDGPAVVLDSDVNITASAMTALDNFNGAKLTLQRQGGRNYTDVFSATGTLSFSSGTVIVSGTSIGSYSNTSGTLVMTFNSNATGALLSQALQQIAYSNSSNTPAATVVIDWQFFDGVASASVGTTTINITATNDAPFLDLDNDNSTGAANLNYRNQYYLGGPAVAIADSDTALYDVDSTSFTSGTLSGLTGFVNAGQEVITVGGQQFIVGVSNSTTAVVGSTTYGLNYDGTDLQITVNAGPGGDTDWKSLITGMTYHHTGTPTDGVRSLNIVVRDSAGTASAAAVSTITVTSNEAPTFSGTIGGTVNYSEGGAAVVLDSDVIITDPELTAADNFDGATLTLSRSGSASVQDVFTATGTLSFSGGSIVLSGTTIGSYTNSNGTLTITFNSNATNARANSAMQQIAYSNSSVHAPSSVNILWTFSDGNTGSQGAGTALQGTGSVTVSIATTISPPSSTDDSVTIAESDRKFLRASDFGSYTGETALSSVRITSLPAIGALEYFDGTSWTAVVLNQVISSAEMSADRLRFVPVAGQTGSPYTTIGFQVFDGTSYSVASYTLTVNVASATDRFLLGNYLQIGLNDGGTLVSDGNAPTGLVTAGTRLGAVSDPERDGWANYDGDFILPGSPVEYWGVSIAGTAYSNLSNSSDEITGSFSNFQSGASGQSIEWQGTKSGLGIRQIYSVGANSLYMDFQIELTNNSGAALSDIYYYRDTDPDNDYHHGSPNGYTTTNTIVSQGDTDGLSMVTSTQVDGSYFAMLAFGENSRVTYGGFGNTDPVEIYSGFGANGLAQSGSSSDDISVSAAYYFASIANGETVTMQMRYYFGRGDGALSLVDLDVDDSSGTLGGNFTTAFIEDAGTVSIADNDAEVVNPTSPALEQMTITISNLLDGTAEQLTADTSGTAITAVYDSGTGVLTLSGLDSAVNYSAVLRSVEYLNTSETPTTTTRQITVTTTFEGQTSFVATSEITVSATNDQPVVDLNGATVGMDNNATFTNGGPAVVLAPAGSVLDGELSSVDNFDGSTLTLSRNGGSDAEDIFSATGGLTFSAGNIIVSGTTIGTYTNGAGELVLTFNASATNSLVNLAIQQIAYNYVGNNPPATVQLDWTFDDGNTGTQGPGGVLTTTSSTVVTIITDTIIVDTVDDTADGDTSSLLALRANKGADGRISLREAILASNNTAGTDFIEFLITDPLINGVHTITPASALPTITGTVILDGTTDDDFAGTPIIVLDGNNLAATGLTLGSTADGSAIQGLIIRDFNGSGIEIQADSDGNRIVGNYIGSFDADGYDAGAAEANTGVGIRIFGANNLIGSVVAGFGNAIAGNSGDEIVISGSLATGNIVQGNLIGTTADESTTIYSGGTGIFIDGGAAGNLIGGTATGAGNVIGGNDWAGIELKGTGTSGNVIQGNWIGVDSTGTLDFGNNEQGIRTFQGATNNTIGGTSPGAGNVIAYNAKGVSIYSVGDTGNAILGNSIYSNIDIGIDLGEDGITANDSGDSDAGANNLQNFPVLTSAVIVGSDTVISGTLNSTPGTTFRIEFFTSVDEDGSGYGEAETYLDAITVTTDASGNATINFTLVGWALTDGEFVTATATEDFGGNNFGSTSEFAANVVVASSYAPVLVDGGTVSMSEGGTATPFLGVGTVTDLDSADFNGGTLTASIASGIQTGDTLILATVGGVTVSGTDLLVGGVNVGTVFGGAAGVPLNITFNANATVPRVQSVYQAVSLTSSVDIPVLGLRTISVSVTDGDGGTSNTATGVVDFNTAINDTPVVTPSGPLTVLEDTAGVISLSLADPDAAGNALRVTLSLSNGSGTFSLASTTGLSFTVGDGSNDASMSFTGTVADLNNALASINFTPTTGFNGADSLQFTVDDQGNTGSGGAQTANGSIAITVDSENDAPILVGANNLTAIDEDNVFNNGTLVSDLITGLVTDPDPGTSYGIAVTAVDNLNGTWQYTTDNGSNWLSFGSVSDSTARLLTANAVTRVRFVPNSNYSGNVSNGITFAAWDGTSGIAGSTANIAPTIYLDQFNTNSYSNNNGTGNWTGSWVETDNNGGGASNGLIRVNSGVLEVKSDRINDNVYREVDLSTATSASLSFSYQNMLSGSADVIRFQVSSDGGSSYTDLAVFSSSTNTGSGNLTFDISSHISSNTRIRIIVTSIDQTKTVAFDDIRIVTTTLTGGTTAFSTTTASSSLVVNSVNDEQVFVPGPGQSFSEGSGSNVVTTDTLLTTDADNSNHELVYTLSILPTHGVLKLNGVTLGVSDSFTQAQVNAGQLTYDHDGTEGNTDSFSFSVDDGLGADTGVLVNFQINGVNDNSPIIISNGAGAAAGISVSENSTTVTTVQATDIDLPAQTITYSIVSDIESLDAGKFSIDSVTGVLTFVTAPDFESPIDSDGNNTYIVKVQATDGTTTDTQLITITVTDVISLFEVTTTSDIDDSGLGSSYTIEQLHAAGGGADGKISLREAIIAANSTAGLDTITFNIAGTGPQTISLATALPEITQAVIIDGWSEPDFAGAPMIQLDGSAAPVGSDGLWISSGGSTVRGLIITGFNDRGISLTGGGGNTIVGNWIGINADGTTANGNGTGIYVASANNLIGGTTASDRNVISGNSSANIAISGATALSNSVTGNYIGTSTDGLSAVASPGNGINISSGASGNVIGGGSSGSGNVIAGFANIGIEIFTGANGNSVFGNMLGLNATGTAVLSSGGVGVTINGSSNTTIGGAAAGEGNAFGGFAVTGLWVLGASSDVTVQGNYFGTDFSQTATFTNGSAIEIWNATNSSVGGISAGAGNIIRNTTGAGINILSPSSGISVLGNSISITTGLGIDLGGDGLTSNDSNDSDTGANNLTNFPVITMAARSGATVRVEGTLNAAASTQYRIEVFANTAGIEHSSGFGAGQRYLGSVTVTTDAAGYAAFSTDITAAVAVGEYVSATATDASGNTSEFSANRIIVAPIPVLDLDADDSTGETGADFIASYVEDGSPVNVADADAITFDTDTNSLSRLTVTITNLIDGANEILTANTSGTSLNANYVGGVLTISGTANESEYQQVLRTITYHNTSQNADNTTRILTITVDDSVFTSNTATSRIQILTSNDAPTIQVNSLTISEGGTVVLTNADLFSTDAEQSAAQLTYTISGVSGGRFEYVANAGIAITSFTQAEINSGAVRFVHDGNEAAPSYDVTVSDGLLSNGPQSVFVTFTGVNDTPVMNAATFSVVENSTLGTTVGFATSTDSDVGDTRNYTILSGNINGAFGINAGSGEIVVLNPAALDYEVLTSFSLTIEVSDVAGASSTAVVTINVTNVSDNSITAISDTNASNEIIAEDSANGTIVGITALATDADAADTISYSLTDDAGGRFAIDSVTGIVTVANGAALDYETSTSHNITIRASSTDGSFSTRTFLIQLTDINEGGVSAISDLNASANSVAENSSNGSTVGYTAFAADPDSTDSVSYSLVDNAGGRFAIDSVTGIITVADGSLLDREAAASHTIIVRATSTDGSMAVLSVDISLIDVNEFAISTLSDLDAAANIVAELSLQGTLTGITVYASDADATTNTITYTLDDDAGGRFQIDSVTGVITVGTTAIDYETATSYTVTVRASSADGGTRPLVITINITDVNESGASAVTDNDAAVNQVLENAITGTLTGITAHATDPDGTDLITYSLDNNAGGRFQIDSVTGVVTVANGTLLDREVAASHSIIIRATSTDSSFSTQTFIINVGDVDEFDVSAISDANLSIDGVNENSANGTTVGVTASAFDSDVSSNTITWSLDDNAGGRFAINSVSGIVTVANSTLLDAETATSHTIIVRATSADTSFATRSFVIAINDVNEFGISAVSDSDATPNAVDENAAFGTNVGITAAATDGDSGTNGITYVLTDNVGGRFAIDSVTGVVTVADGTLLNRENLASHSITVRAISADGTFSTQTFSIAINDVNEFNVSGVVDSNAAANALNENSANGTVAGITAVASDADATTNVILYSLDNNAGGRFQIDANTGVITVADGTLLDFESSTSHTIIVRATSADSSSSTQTFVISLLDTNDAPPVITPGQQFNVSELASTGTVFGTAVAVDPDGVGTLQNWTIVSGNTDGIFAINPATGALRILNTAQLNFETNSLYTLTLSVGDGSTTSLPQTVLVRITDGNEAPTFGAPTPLSIDENSSSGTTVGSVSASDVDAGDVLSYSIISSTPASPFAIDAATGIIRVVDSSLLDFEARQSITLQIQATDAGGLTAATSVVISLNDLNETPTLINLAGGTVQENRGAGTFVGQLSAIDPDAAEILAWTLVDDAGGTFVVNSSTGRIDVAAGATLNFEQTAAYDITVEVTDSGGLNHLQTFTIRLLDVNDAPIAASDLIPGIQLTGIEVLTPGLLLNDFDEDGDQLQAVLASTTANGVLLLRADGSLLYSPNGVFSGLDTFVYYVTDGMANSAPVTVTIDVAPAVGGSSGGGSGDSADSGDSSTDSSGGDTSTDSTDSSTDSGDEMTVVTTTQFLAPPAAASARPESSTTPSAPVAEQATETGPSASNTDNVTITGELLASVFVSDFFVNTRSERIRTVSTELAEAAVFGGLILDNRFNSPLVSLNFFTIDQLVQTINEPTVSEREELAGKVAVGSAAVVTTSLSVGYVIWILRGGSLLTTFMSALPAWQAFDPLPVLQSFHKAVEEDDDSLLSMVTKKTVDGLKKLRKS